MSSRRSRSGGTRIDDHAQPVVADPAGTAAAATALLEIDVGGGHHAHVDVHRPARADRPHLALLQDAQQLHLQRRRRLADLVEEDRAAVRLLEQPFVSPTAPVNAPRTWPNSSDSSSVSVSAPQLTGTNGRAARAAVAMDRPRHQLLARAALADDQHRRVRVGRVRDLLVDRRASPRCGRSALPAGTSRRGRAGGAGAARARAARARRCAFTSAMLNGLLM